MKKTLIKLLKILYENIFFLCGKTTCHQLPERSIHIKGVQIPLCARCTGLVLGYIIGIIMYNVLKIDLNIWLALLLIVPLGLDWTYQRVKLQESTNTRRLISGILGAIGVTYIIIFLI